MPVNRYSSYVNRYSSCHQESGRNLARARTLLAYRPSIPRLDLTRVGSEERVPAATTRR
jgi:hypothetical protein